MRFMPCVFACLFILLTGAGHVGAAPPPGITWAQDLSRSDEFNDSTLDTSKWISGPLFYGSTGPGWPFKQENGYVSNGKLNLWARPGNPITVAAVHSKFLLTTDSYLEIQAKCLPWAARILTALWVQGPFEKQYNPNVEIDIQEVFDPRKITSTMHLWNANPTLHVGDGVGHAVDAGTDVTADYHRYGLERRRPNIVRIYFDDKMIYDVKPSDPARYATQERELIFSLEGHLGAPNTANLPAAALIEYVRVYTVSTTAASAADFRSAGAGNLRVGYLQKGVTSVCIPYRDHTASLLRANGTVAWSVHGSNPATYCFNRRTLIPGIYILLVSAGREAASRMLLVY